MRTHLIYILGACALLSSCKVYRNYERPSDLPTDIFSPRVCSPSCE